MHVLDAFKALGLRPPLEFLWDTPPDSTRRLGATTHMLVVAASEVAQGNDVLIVGNNMAYSEALARDCSRFVMKLIGGNILRKVGRGFHFGEGFGMVFFESERTRVRFLAERRPEPLEFRDSVWHQDALRARKGPYHAIREIREENGHFYAYAASGERINIELTEEGAKALVEKDPFRVTLK